MSDRPTKLDTTGVMLPPPTTWLFLNMAKAALVANNKHEVVRTSSGKTVKMTWEQCPEAFQEAFIVEAKAMYRVMALAAGAKEVEIRESAS